MHKHIEKTALSICKEIVRKRCSSNREKRERIFDIKIFTSRWLAVTSFILRCSIAQEIRNDKLAHACQREGLFAFLLMSFIWLHF